MLLLVAAARAGRTPPPSNTEIVVTGEHVEQLKLHTTTDRRTGEVRCTVKRSNGNPAFDNTLCDASRACVPRVGTQ